MFAKVVVVLALVASVSAKSQGSMNSDVKVKQNGVLTKYAFTAFKQQFKKEYGSPQDEAKAFKNFADNLKVADVRNALEAKAGGKATHGVTFLSDLSQSDFESRYLTASLLLKSSTTTTPKVTLPAPSTTSGYVGWVGVYTTPVKDQGYCGSCWAFSATEQIESDGMRLLGTDYILSPEQIVQCDTKAFGCGGGWTESAYGYVKSAGGLDTDASYPYTSYLGVTGTCKNPDASTFVVKLNSYTTISGESSMATYVQTTGPLSVCLDANNWNSYTGGIMYVCGQSVDHCVQAVGVDTDSVGGYWMVRNSWGTSWGEDGYIQLAYGQNTCDITNDPTYTVVSNP